MRTIERFCKHVLRRSCMILLASAYSVRMSQPLVGQTAIETGVTVFSFGVPHNPDRESHGREQRCWRFHDEKESQTYAQKMSAGSNSQSRLYRRCLSALDEFLDCSRMVRTLVRSHKHFCNFVNTYSEEVA